MPSGNGAQQQSKGSAIRDSAASRGAVTIDAVRKKWAARASRLDYAAASDAIDR
jgi:hypothetical protein